MIHIIKICNTVQLQGKEDMSDITLNQDASSNWKLTLESLQDKELSNWLNNYSDKDIVSTLDSISKTVEELNKKCTNKKKNCLRLQANIDEPFTIACVGLYNQGKSFLLNALVDDVSMSSFVVSDKKETVEIKKITENGITYIDTPGLNAAFSDDKTTFESLIYPDLFLFVHKITQDIVSQEIEYLKNIEKHIKDGNLLNHVIFVMSVNEGVSEKENNTVIGKISSQLESSFKGKLSIIDVSSRCYLKGLSENKKLLMQTSNIGKLKQIISEFKNSDEIKKIRIERVDNLRNSIIKDMEEIKQNLLKKKEILEQMQNEYQADVSKMLNDI